MEWDHHMDTRVNRMIGLASIARQKFDLASSWREVTDEARLLLMTTRDFITFVRKTTESYVLTHVPIGLRAQVRRDVRAQCNEALMPSMDITTKVEERALQCGASGAPLNDDEMRAVFQQLQVIFDGLGGRLREVVPAPI